MFYYRCETCGKRVGQIDSKYQPWCSHTNTTYRLRPMKAMRAENEFQEPEMGSKD